MFASSADADVALRAFASAASDARARTRYARSLPAPAVSALLRRLRAPSVSDALPALALLWAGRLPRTELIGALLRSPAADALACEMDVLCRSADTLRDLAAVAAASARSGSPHAERVLLASARALQRRPEPRSAGVAARVVAVAVDRLVVRGSSPAEGVLALADAGFAPAAAPAACVRAEGASSVEPDLFHVLLLLIPRVPPPDRRLLASAALSHAASASGAAARAVLLAAQSAFSEPAAADATLSVLEAALSSDTPARQLGPVDVALAYALLSHSPSKSRALALLRSLHAATDDRFAAGMPGPSSAPRVPRASRALTSALALPGFGPSAHVAADLLDALARARVPDVSGAMTALFRSQPPARPRLLGHLFGSLADAGGRTPSSAYIRLLHKLTSSADASALLRPHADVLAGWLASLPSMPFDAAVAVVRALASVAPTLPSLGDRLLGSVRKLAGARARVPRALALHALAALAGAPGVSAALSEEVSSLLSAALARPGAAPALSLLARSARSSPGGRWGPLASAALDLLGRPTALRLDDCFDPHSATPSPLREAAPALAFLLVAAPASPFAAATASALSDPRRSLVDACASPDARATYARASMLARLCEELVASGRGASVLPVYALVFVVRDAVPAQMRVRPAGGQAAVLASVSARERSAHESLAESAEFARLEGAGAVSGECALELADCLRVLSGLGEVEAGVGRFAASVLHAEVLARLVGEYRPVGAAGDGDNELGPAVRAAAANAFMATSPSLSDTPAPTSVADGQTKAPRRTPRRSGAKRPRPPALNAPSPRPTRTPRGIGPIPTSEREPPGSPACSNSTNVTPSISEDATSDASVAGEPVSELEQAVQRAAYEPARLALMSALERRGETSADARLSARSSSVRLLLRSLSASFAPPEWAFLLPGGGSTTALACVRALVGLFEDDFRRGMSNALALDYLELLIWFVSSSRSESEEDGCRIRSFLAESATRLMKTYSLSQIRTVRSLFNLLLASLDHGPAVVVVGDVLAWLGVQQGVLDPAYKKDGKRGQLGRCFDDDILRDAYAMDKGTEDEAVGRTEGGDAAEADANKAADADAKPPVMPEPTAAPKKRRRSSRTSASSAVDTTTPSVAEETAGRTSPRPKPSPAPAPKPTGLPLGARVQQLGLNESEELCLLCAQAALSRLEEAIPSPDSLRSLASLGPSGVQQSAERLQACTGALRSLLATHTGKRLTWARPLARRAAEALCRLLSSAGSMLEGARRELRRDATALGGPALAAVFAATGGALRVSLGSAPAAEAARALMGADAPACAKARRAAARLELDAAAAVAELERHCDDEKALEELRAAYRETVGVAGKEKAGGKGEEEDVQPVKVRRRRGKKTRIRSRNRAVDNWLEEESGDDNFADLEDFVAGLDEGDL